MQRIIADSSLRERLISLGNTRARSFSWDKCAEATALRYGRILS
jgi:hypothetical protein